MSIQLVAESKNEVFRAVPEIGDTDNMPAVGGEFVVKVTVALLTPQVRVKR